MSQYLEVMSPILLRRLALIAIVSLSLVGCDGAEELPAQGKWRVINYWAIWCAPCREEIPVLNALELADDITVFGVNFDGKTGEELKDHRSQLDIRFAPLERDPMGVFGVPKPQVLPTTLIVDPTGTLVTTLVGPQTEASLTAALATAGRKKAPPSPQNTTAASHTTH